MSLDFWTLILILDPWFWLLIQRHVENFAVLWFSRKYNPWSWFLKTGWYDREFKTGACLALCLVITLTMPAPGVALTNTDLPAWRQYARWNGGIIETSLMDSTFTIFQTDCSEPTMLWGCYTNLLYIGEIITCEGQKYINDGTNLDHVYYF